MVMVIDGSVSKIEILKLPQHIEGKQVFVINKEDLVLIYPRVSFRELKGYLTVKV